MHIVERACAGAHERKRVPCSTVEVTCGHACGKALPCGAHACARLCHAGPCLSAAAEAAAEGGAAAAAAEGARWAAALADALCSGDSPRAMVCRALGEADTAWGEGFTEEAALLVRRVREAWRGGGAPSRGAGALIAALEREGAGASGAGASRSASPPSWADALSALAPGDADGGALRAAGAVLGVETAAADARALEAAGRVLLRGAVSAALDTAADGGGAPVASFSSALAAAEGALRASAGALYARHAGATGGGGRLVRGCGAPCASARPGCGHPCGAPCHPGEPCPPPPPCTARVTLACPCGRLAVRVDCAWSPTRDGAPRVATWRPSCDALCASAGRVRALSAAPAPVSPYPDALLLWARDNEDVAERVERALRLLMGVADVAPPAPPAGHPPGLRGAWRAGGGPAAHAKGKPSVGAPARGALWR